MTVARQHAVAQPSRRIQRLEPTQKSRHRWTQRWLLVDKGGRRPHRHQRKTFYDPSSEVENSPLARLPRCSQRRRERQVEVQLTQFRVTTCERFGSRAEGAILHKLLAGFVAAPLCQPENAPSSRQGQRPDGYSGSANVARSLVRQTGVRMTDGKEFLDAARPTQAPAPD